MSYQPFTFLFLALLMFACNDSKFSKKELKEQQAGWDSMMEGHDRIMPQMNDIYQASKALKKIAEENMVAADDTHPRAMEAIKQLELADDAMMDWMANISENQLEKLRGKDMDHTAIMTIITKELKNIESVEEVMESSLKQAKALIQEKS